MTPHTITPTVRVVCRYSSRKTTWFHSTAVQFPPARYHSKWRRRWVGIKGCTRNGHHDPKCPSARRLLWFKKTQGTLVKVLPVFLDGGR
ncbi:uncharacterized protein TNCV_2703901 [Trichonephila clavipes]|nr:uncharacterized protein TNCV_2703901 [Trichonephila clavipes]